MSRCSRTSRCLIRKSARFFLPLISAMAVTTVGVNLAYAANAHAGSVGWFMVGSPNHSNFNASEAMYRWDTPTQTYVNVTASRTDIGSDTPTCTGYWAYFAAPVAVQLPLNGTPGDTRSCALSAGWNLVGNPFSDPARIPGGVTAYYYSGGGYSVQGLIPVGGSVWIYETAATTVTITMT
jgi:hypothetical protein